MALPLLGAAAIGAAGSLLSSGLSAGANALSAKAQRQYDYQMWLKQAEYNKPSNQVQRLRDAGLNPALALSNIGTGNMESSAGGQSPVDFSSSMNGLNQASSILSEYDLLKAQAREHNANASIQEFNASAQQTRLTMELQSQLLGLQEQRSRISSSSVDSDLKRKQIGLIDQQIETAKLDLLFNRDTLDNRKRAIQLQNQETESRIRVNQITALYQHELAKYHGALSQAQIQSLGAGVQATMQSVDNMIIDGRIKTVQEAKERITKQLMDLEKNVEIERYGVRHAHPNTHVVWSFCDYAGDLLSAPLRGILKK